MKKPYWWIITTNEKGEEVLIKGAPTESEATSIGYQKISRYFEVKMYPTTSIVEASRYHKGSKLNDTADLDLSMQRLKHTT